MVNITVDGVNIPQVNTSKFLGVHMDEHLKWNIHIDEINKKITKSIGILNRISYLLPSQILINLYYTLIYPYFTYCNLIWTSTYSTHLNKIKIAQKKALRIITKSPVNSHTQPLFQELKLLTITQIRFTQTCEFMYKYHNKLLTLAFIDYFPPTQFTTNTRSKQDYKLIIVRTNTRKLSIKYQGPLLWNNLPLSIRTCNTLLWFKRLLRVHTLEHVL